MSQNRESIRRLGRAAKAAGLQYEIDEALVSKALGSNPFRGRKLIDLCSSILEAFPPGLSGENDASFANLQESSLLRKDGSLDEDATREYLSSFLRNLNPMLQQLQEEVELREAQVEALLEQKQEQDLLSDGRDASAREQLQRCQEFEADMVQEVMGLCRMVGNTFEEANGVARGMEEFALRREEGSLVMLADLSSFLQAQSDISIRASQLLHSQADKSREERWAQASETARIMSTAAPKSLWENISARVQVEEATAVLEATQRELEREGGLRREESGEELVTEEAVELLEREAQELGEKVKALCEEVGTMEPIGDLIVCSEERVAWKKAALDLELEALLQQREVLARYHVLERLVGHEMGLIHGACAQLDALSLSLDAAFHPALLRLESLRQHRRGVAEQAQQLSLVPATLTLSSDSGVSSERESHGLSPSLSQASLDATHSTTSSSSSQPSLAASVPRYLTPSWAEHGCDTGALISSATGQLESVRGALGDVVHREGEQMPALLQRVEDMTQSCTHAGDMTQHILAATHLEPVNVSAPSPEMLESLDHANSSSASLSREIQSLEQQWKTQHQANHQSLHSHCSRREALLQLGFQQKQEPLQHQL